MPGNPPLAPEELEPEDTKRTARYGRMPVTSKLWLLHILFLRLTVHRCWAPNKSFFVNYDNFGLGPLGVARHRYV